MSYRTSNPANLSHEERMQSRDAFVGPFKGTAPEILADGSAIYTADEYNRFYLHIFAGKALRPLSGASGWYRTADVRADAIEHFKRARAGHHAAVLLRRQQARKPHTLKVGDILNTCWGYEQTNVEFYEVVAVSSSMVTLREIAASLTETHYMSGEKMPCPGHFIGDPIRRRANASNGVSINSCAYASPWKGRPASVTWYA